MSILVKPIITEKVTEEAELFNRYGFVVSRAANKIQIKKEIEATYGVNVLKVRTMVYGPKRKTKFTKSGVVTGKTNAFKKAFVQVAEGESIDFYNNL